jgi:hypothetical protein
MTPSRGIVTPFACSQARIDVSIEGRSLSALPRLAIEQGMSVSARGAATPRAVVLALAALVLAAGAIRIHGIMSRYPYMIYVDEGHVVHPASNMYRDRTLDPRRYWHNTLLMTAIDVVVRLVVMGVEDRPQDFRARIRYHSLDGGTAANEEPCFGIVDPPIFLVVGRAIVAVCGTLAVLLMFLLLAEFLPPWPALAGTAVFASLPVLVQYSHFVVGDIPMMLAYLGVYLATLRWSRTGATAWLVASAVASGAACSFKMTGLVAIGFPLVHVALSRSPWRRKLLLSGLVVVLAYVSFHVFCPGLFGKDAELIRNLGYMNGYYVNHDGSRADHLLQLLDLSHPGTPLFGFPLLALAVAGGVGLLLDSDRRRAALPIVLYAVGVPGALLAQPLSAGAVDIPAGSAPALADRLGSVRAAAAILATTWRDGGSGLPRRSGRAVRNRGAGAASRLPRDRRYSRGAHGLGGDERAAGSQSDRAREHPASSRRRAPDGSRHPARLARGPGCTPERRVGRIAVLRREVADRARAAGEHPPRVDRAGPEGDVAARQSRGPGRPELPPPGAHADPGLWTGVQRRPRALSHCDRPRPDQNRQALTQCVPR